MTSVFDTIEHTAPEPRNDEPPKRSKTRVENLTVGVIRRGRKTLAEMVELAFITLEEAMLHADYNTASRAAIATLDRAGFGPKTTVDINSTHIDLSELSREELDERMVKLRERLQQSAIRKVVDNTKTIDVPSVH